jgi:hypothetical protein
MGAIMDLPSDLVIADVASAVYRCPYFALDVIRVGDLAVNDVKSTPSGTGTKYTGTLVNGLDVVLKNPSVTVYSVSRAGRPLGAATATGTVEMPPGASWAFEVIVEGAAGDDYAAFPAGALENP